MREKFYRWLLVPIFAAPLLAWGQEPIAPIDGVIVLQTGSVLTGKISRAGDRYYVSLPDGEIRVRASDVLVASRTLEEAYQVRSAAIRDELGAKDRLDLAHWCLKNKLVDAAARELEISKRLEPQNPRIGLLEREWQLLANPPERIESKVVQASANVEVAAEAPPAPVSRPALEHYVSTVQPLLINNCSTGGCHGPASSNRLHLERPTGSQPLSQRMTYRNLRSVLECIDADNPQSSLLLTRPAVAHGGAAKPVFTERDVAKYQSLVHWVELATANMAAQTPESVAAQPPLLQELGKLRGRNARNSQGSATSNGATSGDPAEPGRLSSGSAADAKPIVEDPFDPAQFNERYAPPEVKEEPKSEPSNEATPSDSSSDSKVESPATTPSSDNSSSGTLPANPPVSIQGWTPIAPAAKN